MKTELINLFRAIIFLIGVALIAILIGGCSPEEHRFTNIYIRWQGEDPSLLEVKINGGPWQPQANGEFHFVEFLTFENDLGEPMYRLSYASNAEFDFVYFTGFNNYVYNNEGDLVKDTDLELPLDYKRINSFSSTGRLLIQDEYEISLSRYNHE